jgi:hypothetical protein
LYPSSDDAVRADDDDILNKYINNGMIHVVDMVERLHMAACFIHYQIRFLLTVSVCFAATKKKAQLKEASARRTITVQYIQRRQSDGLHSVISDLFNDYKMPNGSHEFNRS